MLKFPYVVRKHLRVFSVACFLLAFLPAAFAQADFFLQASPPNPSSVDPGVGSGATITLGSLDGFNSPVALSCAITPVETTNPPTCSVSPASSTPPSSPSLSFNTTSLTPPVQYTITVTGVSGGITHAITVSPITVLAVSPTYAIAVQTTINPTSVTAGSGASAILSITPTNGYSGMVTPGCSSITPAAEPSPVCSFSPSTVSVTNGAVATTTLTISTTNTTVSSAQLPGIYRQAFPISLLMIAGFTAAGWRRKKFPRFFSLFVIAAGLGLLPACNASKSVNNGSVTPKNTYTFTITAYDDKGISATNTDITVTLTVN